jgi:hypothetical protein
LPAELLAVIAVFRFSILDFGNFGDFGNLFSQLHHINPFRTLRPVVYPAHNHVALFRVVPVPQEFLLSNSTSTFWSCHCPLAIRRLAGFLHKMNMFKKILDSAAKPGHT